MAVVGALLGQGFEEELRDWLGDGYTSAGLYVVLVLAVVALATLLTGRSKI